MPKKTEAQLQRAELIDNIRTIGRMKHRFQLRRELNEIESEYLAEFDRRVMSGEPYQIDPASILEDLA